MLFSSIGDRNVLSDRQAEQLEALQNDPTVAAVGVLRVHTDVLRRGGSINLNLSAARGLALSVPQLLLYNTRIEERSPQDYSWFGRNLDTNDQAVLVVTNESVYGTITAGSQKYSLRPLDGSLHALIQINDQGFPPDEPPSFERRPSPR